MQGKGVKLYDEEIRVFQYFANIISVFIKERIHSSLCNVFNTYGNLTILQIFTKFQKLPLVGTLHAHVSALCRNHCYIRL